jgi:glycosyltransferase involved in cell wall biosynthesis
MPEPVEGMLFAAGRRMPPRVRRFVRYASRYSRYSDPAVFPARPPVPETPVRLFVGPANFAGQGWAWARAAERHVAGVGATAFSFGDGYAFTVDYAVPMQMYALSRRWQKDQRHHVTSHYTHVLIEAERPVLGTRYGSTCDGDIRVLRRAGLAVALISHGSDLRIPSRHAQMVADSPFRDSSWETVPILERTTTHNAKLLNTFDGHTYVSTLDLLDYAPGAVWCPGVVDVDTWATETVALGRRVPVVVHAPSKGRFKGSRLIDPIMEDLDRRGLVRYRRIERVDPRDMPAVYTGADIVIDQFTMGLYGVAACEAMAAGRVVVSYVGDTVRSRVRDLTGGDLPIIEATPETLVEVIEKILDDRGAARDVAMSGPSYVREHHDGRRSAAALGPFLTGGIGG